MEDSNVFHTKLCINLRGMFFKFNRNKLNSNQGFITFTSAVILLSFTSWIILGFPCVSNDTKLDVV